MIFRFFSHISSSSSGGFSLIDPLSSFPPQSSHHGFGRFFIICPFETHQLPYGARMFSVVSRFSSLVSLIGLGGFSPGSHFFSTIPCSTELAFEEGGNCNNVTLGTESSQSGSHVTIIIQNFTLVSLTSTTIPHLVGLSFRATILSHSTHSTTYALNSSPSTQLESIFGCGNYPCFVYLLKNEVIISWASLDGVESELSVGCNRRSSLMKILASSILLVRVYWLDDEGSLLVYHWYWSGLLARWQKSTFGMSLVLVRVLTRWQRADTSKLSLC